MKDTETHIYVAGNRDGGKEMRLNIRRSWILLLGLLLVLIGSIPSCSQPEQGYTRYENTAYGYSLLYPSAWILDNSEPENVWLYPKEDSPLIQVNININDIGHELPIESVVDIAIESLSEAELTDSFTLVSSQPLSNKWDWLWECTYLWTYSNLHLHELHYITNTDQFQYELLLAYETDTIPVELKSIADSFSSEYTAEPLTPYENTEYGYSLLYPSAWILDKSEPDDVSIHPKEDNPFLYANIGISEIAHELPIESVIAIRIEAISEAEWASNFVLVSSQSLSNKWDWLWECTYVLTDYNLQLNEREYIKNTDQIQYRLVFTYETDSIPAELKSIADSFSSEYTYEPLTPSVAALLVDYQGELQQAAEIAVESMNQAADALRDPASDVDMVTYRKRIYEITLIHANTIKTIDSRPKYAELHSELWDEGVPPILAWSIPEDEYEEIQYEEYLNGYISFHDWVVDKLARRLQ